jgi:hypothetical protein
MLSYMHTVINVHFMACIIDVTDSTPDRDLRSEEEETDSVMQRIAGLQKRLDIELRVSKFVFVHGYSVKRYLEIMEIKL